MKHIVAAFLLALVAMLCAVPVVGYADEAADSKQSPYQSLSELEGKRIGALSGTLVDQMVESKIPNAEVVYFNSIADELLALSTGTVDACGCDEAVQYAFLSGNPNITVMKEPLDVGKVGACFTKDEKGQRLCSQFNELIRSMNADGRMLALKQKWFTVDYDDNPPVDFSDLQGENGALNVYVDQTTPPTSYMKDGRISGFDVDLVYQFCKEYGYTPEFYYSNVLGSVQAISTGKGDMALSFINITEERAEQVLFSNSYASNNVMVFTLTEKALAEVARVEASSPLDSFTYRFQRSFLDDNRWMLYVTGLGTTLLITLISVLLGSLLSLLFCAMGRSPRAWIRGIFKTLSALSAGIPILVFLMILFYVVFAKIDMPAVLVASIGFAIYFGLDMGEALKNSLDTVPREQWETCHVLGMRRLQAMRYVVLPQILPIVQPQYKSLIVNLLKGTSIVGYITIQDLTRMSDIVRSRTFDALFPLLLAAVLYFAVVWIIIIVFNKLLLRHMPAQRVPKLRGVKLAELTESQTGARSSVQEFNELDGLAGEPVIDLSHVKKVYPSVVPLKDVNATIDRGDVVSVIGPSGTGKTTLIRLMNGLEPVSGGSIKVFDTVLTAPGTDTVAATKRINMVFQHFNLFPYLTVVENIMLAPVILNDVPVQEAYDRAMSLLSIVDLHSKAFNYPSELSGGQQQRVAIVRAIATDPEVIAFDEPTSALDPTSVDEVINILGRLRKAGMTMVIVTHDMQLAREVSTRVFFMEEGEIYEQGSVQQIFDDPQRRLTQHFIRQLKIWDIVIDERDFDYLGMLSSVRAFMKKYDMDKALATAVYAQVETMIGKARELLDEGVTISCFIEYSAKDGSADVCVAYDGPQRAIVSEFDEASAELVEFYAQTISYEYTQRNEYVIECRPYDLRDGLRFVE